MESPSSCILIQLHLSKQQKLFVRMLEFQQQLECYIQLKKLFSGRKQFESCLDYSVQPIDILLPILLHIHCHKEYNNRRSSMAMSQMEPNKPLESRTLQKSYTLQKCRRERSEYIQRELKQLMNQQIKKHMLQKQLQKDLEQGKKDYIVMSMESTMERVSTFRAKQRQKSFRVQERHKDQSRIKNQRIKNKLDERETWKMRKARQNLSKMERVRKNYENNQKLQGEKMKMLEKSIDYEDSLLTSGRNRHAHNLGRSSCDSGHSKIEKVKKKNEKEELAQVNKFLSKLKILEERSLKKELKLQGRRSSAAESHKMSSAISKRLLQEQALMSTWANKLEDKFLKFERNRESTLLEKTKNLMQKSMDLNFRRSIVLSAKCKKEEKTAQSRISALQDKMRKIEKAPKRRNKENLMSAKYMMNNQAIVARDQEKEMHCQKIKRLSCIVDKLKRMNTQQTLSVKEQEEIMNNISANSQIAREIAQFINNTKQRYMEIKFKEEEEKVKNKGRKTTSKI